MKIECLLMVIPNDDDAVWWLNRPASDANLGKLVALRQDADGDFSVSMSTLLELKLKGGFSIGDLERVVATFKEFFNYDLSDQMSTVSFTTIVNPTNNS